MPNTYAAQLRGLHPRLPFERIRVIAIVIGETFGEEGNRAVAALIQEKAFSLGWRWLQDGFVIQYTHVRCFYFYRDMTIGCDPSYNENQIILRGGIEVYKVEQGLEALAEFRDAIKRDTPEEPETCSSSCDSHEYIDNDEELHFRRKHHWVEKQGEDMDVAVQLYGLGETRRIMLVKINCSIFQIREIEAAYQYMKRYHLNEIHGTEDIVYTRQSLKKIIDEAERMSHPRCLVEETSATPNASAWPPATAPQQQLKYGGRNEVGS